MKRGVFIVLLVLLVGSKSFAQQSVESLLQNKLNPDEPSLPTREVIKHINEDVYIYDIIYGYRVINDTLKVLYIGGKYPKQKVTIFVKGKEPNSHVNFKKGDKWHFSGRAFIYKRKPAITVTNSVQFGTRIQI